MFDKKLYVETYSALHASKDTLAEVLRIAEQRPRKMRPVLRPAAVLSAVVMLTVSTAVLAAGSRLLYAGWVHHASLTDAEKMGFHYPEQLGEYQLVKNSPTRIHISSPEANWLTAWMSPDYTWMSLDYENEKTQSLNVRFGKTDNPLWTYCFSFDEKTGTWLGSRHPKELTQVSADSSSFIENVTEYEYEGRTIYLADRVTEYYSENDVSAGDSDTGNTAPEQRTETEAHWADPETGLCFSITSADSAWDENVDSAAGIQNIPQNEMLKYVKSVIDCSF